MNPPLFPPLPTMRDETTTAQQEHLIAELRTLAEKARDALIADDAGFAVWGECLRAHQVLHAACSPDRILALLDAVAARTPSPDTGTVKRFEVIDHRFRGAYEVERGRIYAAYDCAVELSYQDGGRTLKVFIDDPGVQTMLDSPAPAVPRTTP